MELISVIAARSIWLVNTSDLNPKGLRLLPQLTDALVDAYDFDDPADETPSPKGVMLRNGVFVKGEEEYRVGMDIYDDGFVGESAASTALTDEFLEHVIEWAKASFELKFSPDLLRRKVYHSEVVVRFRNPVAAAFHAFAKFSELLTQRIDAPGGEGFILNTLAFGTRMPVGNNTSTLTIERRINVNADANIFFCKGPLRTEALIEILSEFDELLESSAK